MLSAFLCTGRTEDLIALGDTGQPVHKAAIQIITALKRKSPDLAKFLAVPKSNEQGDVIDWYSPVAGEVISWASANDIDRSDARQKLESFKTGIARLSQTLVDSSKKNNQIDAITFGKLLGLASFCPDDIHVSIVKSQRANANGVGEAYNQPVLSFWGFINTEEDRKLEPLYFLSRPRPVPKIIPPSQATLVSDKKMPWWRLYLWWLLPLLLLLLLLLLGLLRGCIPNAQMPIGATAIEQATEINKPIILKEEIAQSFKGSQIILKNMTFLPGSDQLLQSSMPILNELLAVMKDNPTLEIEIQGHICCELESDEPQKSISEQRAKTVYFYLVNNGIDGKRLSYHGFGHQFPITLERNEEEKIQNRRVEIKITNK